MKRIYLKPELPLALTALLLAGCFATKPTYVDIDDAVLERVAKRIGTDVDTMLAEHQDKLRRELSDELGMDVQKIHVEMAAIGSSASTAETMIGAVKDVLGDGLHRITTAVEDMPSGSSIDDTLTKIRETVEELPDELSADVKGLGGLLRSTLEGQKKEIKAVRTVVAEIKPATTEAVERLMREGMENPAEPTNWFRGALAAGGVLLAGALGLRGRQTRKRNGIAAKPAANKPPPEGESDGKENRIA